MMKVRTHIQTAVSALLVVQQRKAYRAAKECGIDTSTISRLHLRPSPITLKSLCHRLAQSADEARNLLAAHLLDEIERAGMTGQVKITIEDANVDPELDHLIKLVRQAAQTYDEARDYLKLIEDLVHRHANPESLPPPPEISATRKEEATLSQALKDNDHAATLRKPRKNGISKRKNIIKDSL